MRGAQPDLYGRRQGALKRRSGGGTGAVRARPCGRSDHIYRRSAAGGSRRTAVCRGVVSCARRTRRRRRPSGRRPAREQALRSRRLAQRSWREGGRQVMKELDRTIVGALARVARRAGLAALLAVMAAILLASAAEAATLPSILTQDAKHPFRVRPASIDYTGDATGFIGGTDGTSVRQLGHIQWPVYTSRQAVGRG